MSVLQQQLLDQQPSLILDQQPPLNEPLRDTGCDAATLSRVVEFIVPEVSLQQLAFIFPLLGHLSFNEDPRWLTCIGPQLLSKKDCRQFGLNRFRLLQVLPSQRCDVIDIAERALAAGRSHTVFCQAESISAQDLQRLESAAERGQARCVIARRR